MDRSIAVKAAAGYCEAAGLSVEKLMSQLCGYSYDDYTFEFIRFPHHRENIWIDEGEKGVPILRVNADLSVEETGYTRIYLSND